MKVDITADKYRARLCVKNFRQKNKALFLFKYILGSN